MKKRYLMVLMSVLLSTVMMAQNRLTGYVVDKQTDEPMSMVSVALSNAKSGKFVTGVVTDSIGAFSLLVEKDGDYKLKISSVGYKDVAKNVSVKGKDIVLGRLEMTDDAVLLKEVVATGQAAKVVVKEDTFVYNAAAYHTPEGSVVEELVKRLPGAQIGEDGSITINGKTVKKIKVDGKEFMTGDTETALKNLPTNIIEKVRSYDEKSDQARITGIDDGEEETVLDFGIKRGMNKGSMMNVDLGIGTKQRYSERGMAAYMKENLTIMGFGSANNVGDRGFPGGGGGFRGGFGGNNNGLNASKMAALNINYQNKEILKIDGSVRWNHRDGDVWSASSTENFYGSESSSFGNSTSQSFSRSNSWNAQMRLEWNPDSMTNIMFRPNIRLSTNDNLSNGFKASFTDDPYKYTDNPLETEYSEEKKRNVLSLSKQGIALNDQASRSLSYSESNNVNAMAQITRKFGNKGRNVSLQVNARYSDGKSYSSSIEDVYYYLLKGIDGNDSTKVRHRYNSTPTKNYSFNARTTYSEPLGNNFHLQFAYNFAYSKQKSDRSTYNYDAFNVFADWNPVYRDWDGFLGRIENPLSDKYLDREQSKYSEYDNYTHDAQIMLRKTTSQLTMSAGFMVQPQHSDFKYRFMNVDTIVSRNVVNFSPSLDVRWKFDKVTQLRATYRGSTSQPSMSDMLDISDDSDPQRITMGNPGLKPSFTQSFNMRFNTYKQSHMQSLMTFVNASMTNNSISQSVQYNQVTGGTITRPENINGNWNAGLGLMYNASIDSTGVWNINTFSNINYNNRVGYLFQNGSNLKSTTRSTTVWERLAFSYRSELFDIEPNGSVNYTHSTNELQKQNNLDTWTFNYGINVTLNCPWGTSLSTDASMNSRRGFNDSSMNTNEFIWNVQVSQSFLKGRALTVMLQLHDILHNQSNFSRSISAMQRSDVQYNNINSYAMLHIVYNFNKFGGGNKGMMPGGPGGPGGPGMRGGFDGRRPNFGDPRFRR